MHDQEYNSTKTHKKLLNKLFSSYAFFYFITADYQEKTSFCSLCTQGLHSAHRTLRDSKYHKYQLANFMCYKDFLTCVPDYPAPDKRLFVSV